jgi:L,D-peptidoglycan transpeptidase YkuD (ErfK/YbiS/YcfS/YnhG family)
MSNIVVTADGWFSWHGERHRCALGRAGIIADKHEGDGGTPVGRFHFRRILYRPDRLAEPECNLPIAALAPTDGWCNDPGSADYNCQVRLPTDASAEELWRHDGLYDLLVVMAHNDDPAIAGRGSAIFLHVAPPDGGATEGCVALPLPILLRVVAALEVASVIEIKDQAGGG